jgi:hypothetical protein
MRVAGRWRPLPLENSILAPVANDASFKVMGAPQAAARLAKLPSRLWG